MYYSEWMLGVILGSVTWYQIFPLLPESYMYKWLTPAEILSIEDGEKKKGKFNRIAFGLVRQLGNLNCVVCLWGVTAGLALSPGLLICAAHLPSAGALKFPLTHWGAASHTQHKRKERKEREDGREGRRKEKPADSHLSPPSASNVPRAAAICQSSHRWPPP